MLQRNLSLDILKIVLAFFVVGLHCQFLLDININAYYATVHGIFRLSVPIFLVISGYYFYNITNIRSLKKWCFRITSLYIFWMFVYSPIWLNVSRPLLTIFTVLNGYYVLWYLIGTLISGIFVYSTRHLKTYILISTLLLLYLTGFFIQIIGNLHILPSSLDKFFNLNYVHRNAIFMCIPFFLIGYLINRLKIDKIYNPKLYIVILVVILIVIESFLHSKYISSTEGIDQLLLLLLAAPIIFIYFKNITINGESKELVNFSTAIFLIHPLFLFIFSKYLLLIGQTNSTFFILICSIISAFVLVFINKKIKYIL